MNNLLKHRDINLWQEVQFWELPNNNFTFLVVTLDKTTRDVIKEFYTNNYDEAENDYKTR